MASDRRPDPDNEAFWRDFLMHPDSMLGFGRRVLSRIPASPRCHLCGAPFAGPGAPVMRLIGKRPSEANPVNCTTCYDMLVKHHGGAEVEGSLLFADIRGSTALAEGMSTREFRTLLDRFYTAATAAVFACDGQIDKFVGDELVALFPPVTAGVRHAARAVDAARAVLQATGHGDPGGPWVPLGAGVHTGRMWFGAVGVGGHTEVTVVGDAVNTTARLAAAAGPGEILVSSAVAEAAGIDGDLERRTLELKGKAEPFEVVVL